MRLFLAETLAAEHEITESADGREALEILASIALPNLIVSDIMIPNLDGIGLFEATRASESLSTIPFMFLTAPNEIDEKIKLRRGGSIEYMVKPFSVDELRAKVSAIISLRNSERDSLLERVQSAINGTFPAESGAEGQRAAARRAETAYPAEPVYPPALRAIMSGPSSKRR